MSSAGKILSYAAGYVLVVFVVGAALLALLSAILMFLVPAATGGAIHIGWWQGIAVVTLALLGRVVLFPVK